MLVYIIVYSVGVVQNVLIFYIEADLTVHLNNRSIIGGNCTAAILYH